MKISGIPKRGTQSVKLLLHLDIINFQTSGKLGPYESNNIQFTIV